jgi:hypothetical protein
VLIFAHAGHWFVSAAYFAPVACFALWLTIVTRREKRQEKQKAQGQRGSG